MLGTALFQPCCEVDISVYAKSHVYPSRNCNRHVFLLLYDSNDSCEAFINLGQTNDDHITLGEHDMDNNVMHSVVLGREIERSVTIVSQ